MDVHFGVSTIEVGVYVGRIDDCIVNQVRWSSVNKDRHSEHVINSSGPRMSNSITNIVWSSGAGLRLSTSSSESKCGSNLQG